MRWRMAAALLSVAGLFVSAYLTLYKLGLLGAIACGSGGCETVQLSPQSRFLGVEVAQIGLAGYAVLLAVSLLSLQPRLAADRRASLALLLLSGGAVLFTGYLKFLEFFVIHAVCRWCVASAVIIALIFLCAVADWRRVRGAAA